MRMTSWHSFLLVSVCAACLLFQGCLPEKKARPVSGQENASAIPPDATPQTPETRPSSDLPVDGAREKVPQEDLFHDVRFEGETLSIIARWYTGSMKNWQLLAEANPDINPHILRLDMRIRIPQELLKTRDPMPETYLDQFYKKPEPEDEQTPEPPDTQEPPDTPDDIELYGPRPFGAE